MADNKYLRAMQQAKEHIETPVQPDDAEPLLAPQPQPQPRRKSIRNVGRPPGKRSNPEWEQVTIFVRKDTKKAAFRRLMDDQNGMDLSELIEQLLAKWSKVL